ncbi:MAG: hypothetical protein HC782_00335 [Gammaproteobacteria bacterium]|nr:hypothetical protein [Gammaproteobacteria bacterium]
MPKPNKLVLPDRDALYSSYQGETTSSPRAIKEQTSILKERQVAELYRAMPSALLLSIAGILLTMLMLYQANDINRGVLWFLFAAGVVLYRVLVYWQYIHNTSHHLNMIFEASDNSHLSAESKPISVDLWITLAIIGNFLAGTLFGLLGTWLYVPDPIYRALFSFIVIMGYVGGSVVPYAPVRFAHAAFAIPACVPTIIYLFFMRDDGNFVAGAIAIFMLVLFLYGRKAAQKYSCPNPF